MQQVILTKAQLLPIVRENLEKHNNIFNASVSGYWQKAEEILTDKLAKVKKQEQVDNYLGVTYPVSYVDHYNKVIRMLELSVEDNIKLSSSEFDAYVRNEWTWKANFLGTNGIYCSGLSVSLATTMYQNF